MSNTARIPQGTPVTLTGISKKYGNRTVLNDINLRISPGQFVAVVGRSGCGKSTLLRLLAGLESTTHGEMRSGSAPLSQVRDDTRLMFQDDRLLAWKKVIDKVGLADRANDWPSALSGGQKQRVALARALIHRPRLLLLDEPLGALDALTRIEMQGLIERLWQQHDFTVLLVTHDVSEAVTVADRVILIEQGQIGLDLQIDLPRPRRKGSAHLAELEAEVLERE